MHSIAYLPILHAELVVDVGGADGDGLVLHPGVLVPLLHSVPSTGDHSVGGADGDGLVLHPAVLVPLLHSVPTTGEHNEKGGSCSYRLFPKVDFRQALRSLYSDQ